MIVKNEAPVIRRCLESVLPLIDCWVIVDTGSTDGTQEAIRAFFAEKGVPGELHERAWKDFAHNRSEALALARPHADYTLIMDADDSLVFEPEFDAIAFKEALSADLLDVEIHHGSVRHHRPQICRSTRNFIYRGVLHEYIEVPPDAVGRATAQGFFMQIGAGGARSQDPIKYVKDALTLEQALVHETDPFLRSRYTFYLAQSYRDCEEKEKALQHYLARAEMGFWQDEVYISLYSAAKLKEQLGHPDRQVIDAYLRAADAQPGRVEALHGASLFCRLKGLNEEGYQIAKRGIDVAMPGGGLFVEHWIHEYGLLDEYAINGYWSGHYKEALDATLRILASGTLPPDAMPRVIANARFAADKLPPTPELGSFGAADFISQHNVGAPRYLRTRLDRTPRVFLAILAKQKEPSLPLYLDCIEALDYPKSSIFLYIRTNNNTDNTEPLLRAWVAKVGHLYAGVEFDSTDVADKVERFGVHEWNPTRFRVLGHIRNVSLRRALEEQCDFYFVADVDNFVRPHTLRELVALQLPIVAPFLRLIAPGAYYSNYHAEVDSNGYFKACDQYHWILNRWVRGVLEMPVVHCTYLIRADVIKDLTYEDSTDRYEYVVFSDSARKAGVPQYLDNRQIYGYITFDKDDAQHAVDGIEKARRLLQADLSSSMPPAAPSQSEEDETRRKFERIYQKNEWGYGSGVGSLPANNQRYMEFVQSFIRDNGIKTVVDFGCGDWQFSRLMDWSGISYVGFDLVDDVIESNRRAYARPGVSFEVFKGLDGIPAADLLLCKDVFQHLPNDIVKQYLDAFKRKFKFLLVTNDDLPEDLLNSEIKAGGWRPIRLDRAPFSEVAPVRLSWTVTSGGWKPTHKVTCLIEGTDHGQPDPISRDRKEQTPTCAAGIAKNRDGLGNIYLINLDRSPDRLARFQQRNAHLRGFQRAPAIDGRLVDRETLLRNGTIEDDLSYVPGALGCALSHMELWKKAVSLDEPITILEDDVICSRSFPTEAERILSGLPADWDFILWGYSLDPLFLWVDFGYRKAKIQLYDGQAWNDPQRFQAERFVRFPVRLVHSFGTQAYSVSPKGARALLDCCIPLRRRLITFPGFEAEDTGIDAAMCAAYPSMQAFVCIPPLVIHDHLQESIIGLERSGSTTERAAG